MERLRSHTVWMVICTLLIFGLYLPASLAAAQDAHATFHAEALDWQPGPASLPEGAEIVLLEGNPAEEGPLTLRLRFPAGYVIPAHTHPAIEHVTVLSGVFQIGMGDALEEGRGTALGVGGFVVVPEAHAHYAWVEEETVIQLHSVGPWGVTYVDPDDDPRNQ